MIYKFYKGHRYLVPILFHHIGFVGALIYYQISLEIIFLILASAYLGFLIFAHFVAHLHFGHKRYEDTIWNKILTLGLVTFIGVSSPLNFVLLHRQHHRYSDTDQDPHSPNQIGWWRVYFLMWKSVKINPTIGKDIIRSKFQSLIYKNFVLIHFIILFLIFLIEPKVVFFVISPCVLYSLHASGIVNWRGHKDGVPRNAPEIAVINPFGWKHLDHHDKYIKKTN